MLGDDDREQAFAEWVCQPLKGSEAIFTDVEVLGREGDEPAFSQPECILVVRQIIDLWVCEIIGPSLKPVLTHNHRSPLTVRNFLGHNQNAVGEYPLPEVKHYLISCKLIGLKDLA